MIAERVMLEHAPNIRDAGSVGALRNGSGVRVAANSGQG
jgi:hypothetical protein